MMIDDTEWLITEHAMVKKDEILSVIPSRKEFVSIGTVGPPTERYDLLAETVEGSRALYLDLTIAELEPKLNFLANQLSNRRRIVI